MALAILNALGRVTTFVRDDLPEGWTPPEGYTAIPEAELPAGWERAPDDSPVPASITARQARLWLIRNGITLARVDAVIASLPDPLLRESVRVEWEYGAELRRSSEMIAQLGPALGLDAARLDQAFREAAAI